ncbi:hypothetical protein GHT06_013506 [Daphnia sinensis]|uniref:Transposable element P transposase-like GTP-binding insertion domain-containing protein n=1 Tax=Daphnia sinensis TaxID=1820382 RepID=A0AAD5KSB8_9CRUS|nr:hypothetical protein GHT06_013506 [Daphnia sinensis]
MNLCNCQSCIVTDQILEIFVKFAGSEATEEYCRRFNKLFDILNSWNINAKGDKEPLNKTNLEEKKKDLEDLSIISGRSRGRSPRDRPPGADAAPGGTPIVPAPTNASFNLDREKGRDLRSWMTTKPKPTEAGQLYCEKTERLEECRKNENGDHREGFIGQAIQNFGHYPKFVSLLNEPHRFCRKKTGFLFGRSCVRRMVRDVDDDRKLRNIGRASGPPQKSFLRGNSSFPRSGKDHGRLNGRFQPYKSSTELSKVVGFSQQARGGRYVDFSSPLSKNSTSVNYCLGGRRRTMAFNLDNMHMREIMMSICDEEIKALIEKEAIKELAGPDQRFASGFFVIPKSSGGFWSIINKAVESGRGTKTFEDESDRGRLTERPWTTEDKDRHINELELSAALWALKSFTARASNIAIQFMLDNRTAVAYIARWCEDCLLTLSAVYIPGALNILTDPLSRIRPGASDWMLDPTVFRQLQANWDPQVDLWQHQPEALAVDAFSLNWSLYRGYAFPPFSLIQDDSDSPGLAIATLVPGSDESGLRTSSNFAFIQRDLVGGQIVATASNQSAWNGWRAWCFPQSTDPLSPGLNKIPRVICLKFYLAQCYVVYLMLLKGLRRETVRGPEENSL